MKQVVDITERRPRHMGKALGEEQAYKEHVSYQSRFDEERVAFGLDPLSSGSLDKYSQPAGIEKFVSAKDKEPESIFASQFAGLADFMQSILDEKAANDQSQPGTNDSTSSPGSLLQFDDQEQPQDVLDTSPSIVSEGHIFQTNQSLPSVSQPVMSRSNGTRLTQEPVAAIAGIIASQARGPNLMQSRWRDQSPDEHAPSMSLQHRHDVMRMSSGQSVSPTSSIQPSAGLYEAAQSSGAKPRAPSPSLPSGSSWW